MAPSAIDGPALSAPAEKSYPPAHIFPVKENKFEESVPPQTNGRKLVQQHGDGTAIVIDNGTSTSTIARVPGETSSRIF